MSESLYERIVSVAQANSEKAWLLLPDGDPISYGDMLEAIGQVAFVLRERGVKRGDRVVAHCEKTPLALELYLACLQLGAIYVPLNSSYTSTELTYFLNDAQPSVYVGSELLDTDEFKAMAQLTIRPDGSGTLREAMQSTMREEAIASCRADDVAALLYTSGTTGRSKGAMLTHGNLLSNAQTLNEVWGFTSADVLLHALPIYHVHGLFVAVHCAMLAGASMIFLQKFSVDEVRQQLANATVLMGVPTFYTRLLGEKDFGAADARNMRLFISGSAPLTEQTFREFSQRTGMEILERYGMSETLMNTSNPLIGERKAGTVGFGLPGVEVRIADADGRELPLGEIGGIELRGPNVFPGYWKLPEKTAESFRADGFFVTGDMGVMDEERRVSIVGREKDLVISGGLNVYPAEVETAIGDLAGVLDVAVIGVPHPDFGEGVVAVVVADPKAAIATARIRSQLKGVLAGFKQPQFVAQVDELPRNAMGKVQKNLLRERFASAFEREALES